MASIARTELFCWDDIDELGDLERLKLILDQLPDEPLMQKLQARRGNGRNDYPVRAVWNSMLARIVCGHPTVESLRRELRRNAQLRQVCGFDIYSGAKAVPSSRAYSSFTSSLLECGEELKAIFTELRTRCYAELSGFGRELGADGKSLPTHARRAGKCEHGDRRAEHEAQWGAHSYRFTNADGTIYEKVKRWFGYKLHLIADTTYELPVAFTVLPANANEMPVMHKLLSGLQSNSPEVLQNCEIFTADRGYDDGKLVTRLWDEYQIKPVIDIRNTWQDPDTTRCLPGRENVTYDWSGTVRCVCPAMHTEREMAFGGFEKDRMTLKYRCPARHYGYECRGMHRCPVAANVRIPLSVHRRIFTPIARSSYHWKTLYRRRTAVERINSRIDTSFGFEHHTIRGMAKMSAMVTISLSVMLAVALGRTAEKRPELMRSLVRSAA